MAPAVGDMDVDFESSSDHDVQDISSNLRAKCGRYAKNQQAIKTMFLQVNSTAATLSSQLAALSSQISTHDSDFHEINNFVYGLQVRGLKSINKKLLRRSISMQESMSPKPTPTPRVPLRKGRGRVSTTEEGYDTATSNLGERPSEAPSQGSAAAQLRENGGKELDTDATIAATQHRAPFGDLPDDTRDFSMQQQDTPPPQELSGGAVANATAPSIGTTPKARTSTISYGFTSVNKPRAPIAPMAPMAKMGPVTVTKPTAKSSSSVDSSSRPVQRAKCSRGRGKKNRLSGASLPSRSEVAASKASTPANNKRKRASNLPPTKPPFPGAPLNPRLFPLSVLKTQYGNKMKGHLILPKAENKKVAVLFDPDQHSPVPGMMTSGGLIDLSGYELIAAMGMHLQEGFPVFTYIPAKEAYLYCGEYQWKDYNQLEVAEYNTLSENIRNYWTDHLSKPRGEQDEFSLKCLADHGGHSATRSGIMKRFVMKDNDHALRLSLTTVMPLTFYRPTYEALTTIAEKRDAEEVYLYDRAAEESDAESIASTEPILRPSGKKPLLTTRRNEQIIDDDSNDERASSVKSRRVSLRTSATPTKVTPRKKRIEEMDATEGAIGFPYSGTHPSGSRPKRSARKNAGTYDVRRLSRGSMGDMSDVEGDEEAEVIQVDGVDSEQEREGRRAALPRRRAEALEMSEEE